MRIEFTLTHAGLCRDVAVSAPGAIDLGSVRAELARACAGPDDAPFWAGDRSLPASAIIGDAGLRTGSVVSIGTPAGAEPGAGILSLQVIGGPQAGLVAPLGRGRIDIGRDAGCDVVLADVDASRQHASIDVTATSMMVRDLGSTNGTWVDGRRIDAAGVALRPGDLVRIGDTMLTVGGPADPPVALQPAEGGGLLVLRPPRRATSIDNREITLPVRAAATRPRGVQWVAALLPAVAGAAIACFTHSLQFLLFALLSPVMVVSSSLGDRLHWRRSRRRDAASFAQRNAAAVQQIKMGLRVETAARRAAAPDPADVLRIVSMPSVRLWERSREDPDLMRVRLGTADLAATLRTRDGVNVRAAGVVASVPVCIDLRDGPLGVAGPPEIVAGLARWLIGQLAALHSPSDLQLALLVSACAAESWQWARWLPHLQCRVAATQDEWLPLMAELAAVVDQRSKARRLDPNGWCGPWLVVVVDRAARLADLPGLAPLLERGREVGVTAVCLDTEVAQLPTGCPSVARVVGVTGTRLAVRAARAPDETEAIADRVSLAWADRVARGLAPLVDAARSDSTVLPAGCTLGDVLGADYLERSAILGRWANSRGNAQTVLGLSVDGPVCVDLVADGPHALIAGTTGAGKSELLQMLVVGLAANHAPEDVNFLLVDYKGGAAFADCARLPHTAGLVTDLDGYLTARALRSLDSELQRRERLFAAAGANDLSAYRAGGPEAPLARLVIVVDEFAALAEELPDFVRGLVAVAQRGRSLGVHLVLATQRPGSAVSAEIRANTTLRIALRVTDPGESSDVIDVADAALIERSRPGRGYLRAGSTLTCLQTAHPGADNRPDPAKPEVELLGAWRRPNSVASAGTARTDLNALVEALRSAAADTGRVAARTPWLPPLPPQLARTELDEVRPDSSVAFATVDLPAEQARAPVTVNLAEGTSLLAVGAPRSGRTTLLTSIAFGAAERLGPDRLQIYLVDPTGALAAATAALPHCATIAGPSDPNLCPRLLRRLEDECARRVTNGTASVDSEDAALLLLVDGWETVLANLGDPDAAACADLLAGLLRAGAAAGLTLVVTGDRTTLAPRFAGAFATKLALRLADVGDYGLAGIAPRDVPTAMPAGRAVRAGDASVMQIAHAGETASAAEAQRVAASIAASWATSPGRQLDARAIRIRALPRKVLLDSLPAERGRLSIGLIGDEGAPLRIDPFAGAGRVLVAGPPRSGRSTLLRSLLLQARAQRVPTVVAAGSRSPLASLARESAVALIDPKDGIETIGPVPTVPTLLLVDDSEAFVDTAVSDRLVSWIRTSSAPLAAVVAGRADELATTYRGVGPEVRRSHCGILLRPGPVDGELLGVRLSRRCSAGPPGRGVVIGDPSWNPLFGSGDPIPVQVAQP